MAWSAAEKDLTVTRHAALATFETTGHAHMACHRWYKSTNWDTAALACSILQASSNPVSITDLLIYSWARLILFNSKGEKVVHE